MTDMVAPASVAAAEDSRSATRFPIRVKILVSVLLVIMLVIGVISATMASLFHQDKTAYIHGLTALMARHAARETSAVIRSRASDLAVFESVMLDDDLMADQKSRMLAELFGSYGDFVAAGLATADTEPVLVYDSKALGGAGLAADALRAGLADGQFPGRMPEEGELVVRNVTLSDRLSMLGIAYSRESAEGPVAVIAWTRLASLLDATTSSSAFSTMILDSQGRLFVNESAGMRPGTVREPWLPVDLPTGNLNTAESSRELKYGHQELIAGFAPVGIGDLLIAVRIPKSSAYLTSRELLERLLLVALGLFVTAGLLTLVFSQKLTRPLEILSEAARAVGRGHFNVRVQSESGDEIGLLSESFNQMTGELENRDKALEQAQIALIQSEKMGAFGQISAGIAHEVKNPLAGILGYAQLGMNKLDDDHPVTRHLQIIEKETRRCTEIIGNLMKFARQESSVKQDIEVNGFIEDSMSIVAHQLGLHGVELHRHLADDLPVIPGNANLL